MAIVAACVATGVAYVAWEAMGGRQDGAAPGAAGVRVGSRPVVLFQHVARDAAYAHVAIADPEDPAGPRRTSSLVCQRVHFAGGRGLCVVPRQTPLGTQIIAKTFGPDFEPLHETRLGGLPSRARVSPDGRYGAATVFVTGHSYAGDAFSTQTTLIDMANGAVIGDLERFAVMRDGRRLRAVDFNFWGVTFARESDRFYATLATRGKTYLVEGSVRGRTLRVLHENVECPSLSPDGSRVAYKKRVSGGGSRPWRLHVLDLETMSETALTELRGVDDQVEWLDDSRILYGLDGHVWSVPADGSGSPMRYLVDALSPAVVQP